MKIVEEEKEKEENKENRFSGSTRTEKFTEKVKWQYVITSAKIKVVKIK